MANSISLDMPLNEVKQFLIANVELQCKKDVTARICIMGSPGCGKSDLMRQVCEEKGWGLVVKYLSNMSLEQITGIPCRVEDGEHAKFTKPEIFNFDELDYAPPGYEIGKTKTILLIDDFHLADKIIQKYLFQLLTYKAINSYKLPSNCAIVMAGNKLTDKALAHTIPAPVMNRISVYNVKADPKDWLNNFAFSHGVRHDIMSFIASRGDKYLYQEPIESEPWASPRSWTYLSDQLDAYETIYKNPPITDVKRIADGLVGQEFAAEFISYRELFSKWNISTLASMTEDNLIKMFTAEVAKSPIAAYAIINSTMSWLIEETKKLDFDSKRPETEKIVKSAYKIMTSMLQVKCKGIQIKPLIIAGTTYLYSYYNSLKGATATKFNNVTYLFMLEMKQQRSIDWIYYEIIAYVFDYQISKEDKKSIDEAKEALKI